MDDPIEIFRRAVDALNRVDRAAIPDVADPDIAFVPMRSAVTGAYLGHAGMTDFLDENAERYGRFYADFTELRPLPDGRLFCAGEIAVTARDGPTETRYPTAGIASFRDGRLASWRDYGNEAAAMAAYEKS